MTDENRYVVFRKKDNAIMGDFKTAEALAAYLTNHKDPTLVVIRSGPDYPTPTTMKAVDWIKSLDHPSAQRMAGLGKNVKVDPA